MFWIKNFIFKLLFELIILFSAGLDAGNGTTGTTSKVRWRKDHVLTYNRPSSLQSCSCYVDCQQQLDKIFGTNHDQPDVELDLVNEIGFIILDTIEQIIQVFYFHKIMFTTIYKLLFKSN